MHLCQADPADVALGHRQVQRWNLPDGWVISARPTHPALVSEADYIAAQDISAARGPSSPPTAARHGHTTASAPDPNRPKNVYIREDRILAHLPTMHLLLAAAEGGEAGRRRRTRHGIDVRYQATPEDVITWLREQEIALTYYPGPRTLHAGTGDTATTITLKASQTTAPAA